MTEDDLGDLDDELASPLGEESGPDPRAVAKVPLPRKDGRLSRIVRREIGAIAPRRKVAEPYLEVHEVAPGGRGGAPEEAPEDEGGVESVWDEDPGMAALEEEEERKSVIKRKRKRDAELPWGWERKTTFWWALCCGAGAALVVGVFVMKHVGSRTPPPAVEPPPRFVSKVPLQETPVAELLTLGQSAIPRLVEILSEVENSPAPAEALVAEGRASVARMSAWRGRTGPKARVKENGVIGLMAAGFDRQGYLLMSGLRDDYTKYVAYFVETEGALRLDWEATVGYSELLPEEVEAMPGDRTALMRVVASPSSFYTNLFPEEEYGCFLLTHLDRERYAWGYIRKESESYELLRDYLSSPVTALTAKRVTIRVRKAPDGALPNQVEIVRILGNDWLERSLRTAE